MKYLLLLLLCFPFELPAQIERYLPTSTTGEVYNHQYYSFSYDETAEQAEWVIYLLTAEMVESTEKWRGAFEPDPLVKSETANDKDYSRSGFDRGHLAPASDMNFDSIAAIECYYYSNITPQEHTFNIGVWKKLENQVRRWAIDKDSIYIVTGPILALANNTIGSNKVVVPNAFYKIVYKPGKKPKMIAFIIPNQKSNLPIQEFAVPVDLIEKITGVDFFSGMTEKLEEKVRWIGW